MKRLLIAMCAGAVGIAICVSAPIAVAQALNTSLLQGLERGEWTVRFRDGTANRKICVKNGDELVQLRHGGSKCNRFVVDETSTIVTVQYTCAGNGYGSTTVRRETPTLVQVESRGIASGLPFEFQAEARRTGTCK
jgi:hypothetical protein